ncbi:MAG: monovalent cation/H(+) antiporter subunit G [Rhodobacteraceae bacterium]|jgi:multicomponent Na+:H+ antiporter subunit G|nr:monovalent cation/H(+) antiporter subunit G [Paracoccaceae bacterium]
MIASMIPAVASLLMILGAVILVIAAWGVIRLPDALARQHAATKAATLAIVVFALGVLVALPAIEWVWRLLVLVGFLLATLPVASHLLARAAMREMRQQDEAARAPLVGGEGDGPRRAPKAHSP